MHSRKFYDKTDDKWSLLYYVLCQKKYTTFFNKFSESYINNFHNFFTVNYENWFTFAEVIVKIKVAYFFLRHRVHHLPRKWNGPACSTKPQATVNHDGKSSNMTHKIRE